MNNILLSSLVSMCDRKPGYLNEVESVINIHELDNEIKEIITNLPVVAWGKHESCFSDKLDGNTQHYVLVEEETNSAYYVDTQGYSYPRYIAQLVDLDTYTKIK